MMPGKIVRYLSRNVCIKSRTFQGFKSEGAWADPFGGSRHTLLILSNKKGTVKESARISALFFLKSPLS